MVARKTTKKKSTSKKRTVKKKACITKKKATAKNKTVKKKATATLENRELQKFYTDLQEEIKLTLVSEEEGTTPEQVFSVKVLSLLADTGETENCRVSYDEKISKRGVEHKLNGYALYENYETLDLFITLYFANGEIQSATKTEAEKAIDKLSKFFKNAVNNDYVNEIEETCQAFDLAQTLANVKEVKEFLTRVNIFLITNGEVKADIKFSGKVAGYTVFYRVVDINYIFNISEKARLPIEIDFTGNGFQVPCIINQNENEDYHSYLAIIPGNALAEIYEQYGSRLLEQNVRSFLQFTGKYNQGIRKTILEEPHMFLAFNNGIAATAEEIKLVDLPDNHSQGIGYVKDFQIVNGGQTTASIYHAWKKNKDIDISKIFVQLKLTIIRNKENFGTIVGRIAEYANTQNKVSTADLSSNRENHIILEKLSRAIWAPPPKGQKGQAHQTCWFFERARGQYKNARLREGYTPSRKKAFDLKNPRNQVLTKENLAKYINVWKEVYRYGRLVIAPHMVVRGNQKNYSQFLANNYKEKPDNVFFEDTVAKAILFKTSEHIYGIKPNAMGDMRYITVPYSIGWLGHKLDYKLDLYKVWKNQGLSSALKNTLKNIMIKVEKFIKKEAPGSLYGEWAKKEECWSKTKEEGFGINLGVLSDDIENEPTSRRNVTESDIENSLKQHELKLIKSIPVNKWNEINKLGSYIEDLTQRLKDRTINIMSTLKLNKELDDKQRKDAITIIDIIVHKSPEFFEGLDKTDENAEKVKDPDEYKITVDLLKAMIDWSTKAKVLSDKELQYVADFAFELKQFSAFHENNLRRHLQRLIEAGFQVS